MNKLRGRGADRPTTKVHTWRQAAVATAVASALATGPAITGTAASAQGAPAYNDTFKEHKEVFVLEGMEAPCTGDIGTLTEVENASAHLTAAGVTSDPSEGVPAWTSPFRYTASITNHLTFVPDDQRRPTFQGHSHTHLSFVVKDPDGIGTAAFENQIILKGSDGTTVKWHETARYLFRRLAASSRSPATSPAASERSVKAGPPDGDQPGVGPRCAS